MKNLIMQLRHNTLFGFILGGIMFGSIVYGVNSYKSNEVEYSPTDNNWKVSNVGDAINSLYSMKTELDNIKSVGDAVAGNILSGKKAVVKGSTVTGTMVNRGTLNWNPSTSTTYTVPAGYYSGGTLDSSAAYETGYNAGLTNGQKSATVVVQVYGVGGSTGSVGNKTYRLSYPNTGSYSQGDGDTKVAISWQ